MTTAIKERTDTLKIAKLSIQNMLRLTALNVEPKGRHVEFSGPNGSGKTSALDAIWAALGGKTRREMPEPVHRGKEKAACKLELQDETGKVAFIVERTWTASDTSIKVTGADGQKFDDATALLKGFVDFATLNPVAFLALRGQDQIDELLRGCGVNPPEDQVAEVLGETMPAKKGESASAYLERLSADETGIIYVRRRDAHRVVTEKQAALRDGRAALDAIPAMNGVGNVDSLLAERRAKESARERFLAWRAEVGKLEGTLATARERIGGIGRELDDARRIKAQLNEQIADLKKRLDANTVKASELMERNNRGLEVIMKLEADLASKVHAGAVEDPSPEIARIDQDIEQAQASQKETAKRAAMADTVERLEHEAGAAGKEHARHDFNLDRLRELRRNLLNGLDLGVEGLEIGDGELRLKGNPFRQASTAERIRVACALAFRSKKPLKILRLDDAEHLDAASRSILEKQADKAGYQLLLALVRDGGELAVEFVE